MIAEISSPPDDRLVLIGRLSFAMPFNFIMSLYLCKITRTAVALLGRRELQTISDIRGLYDIRARQCWRYIELPMRRELLFFIRADALDSFLAVLPRISLLLDTADADGIFIIFIYVAATYSMPRRSDECDEAHIFLKRHFMVGGARRFISPRHSATGRRHSHAASRSRLLRARISSIWCLLSPAADEAMTWPPAC